MFRCARPNSDRTEHKPIRTASTDYTGRPSNADWAYYIIYADQDGLLSGGELREALDNDNNNNNTDIIHV